MFSTPLLPFARKERKVALQQEVLSIFFPVKDQIVNILGLGRHMASLAAPQCYSWSAKAATG